MTLSLYQFNLLPPDEKLRYVLDHGLFLAQRLEEGGAGLNLYYLPDTWVGYFVEVGVDEAREGLVVRSSFRTTRLLEAYVLGVQLPERWA